jgi:hypothetical protein
MARRSVPPPKPKSPTLTVGQKRRRLERLQKCIIRLEAFDPQKARKRAPTVLELEAAIDKALSSAFGYGTPAYLRYNQAATLDPSPLITNATLRSPALAPGGGPARHNAKAHEVRQNFSENKERSIALLRQAISTIEDEIADAEPVTDAAPQSKDTPRSKGTPKTDDIAGAEPVVKAAQQSTATPTSRATLKASEVRIPRRWGGIAFESAWRRVARWWRGRDR